MQIKLWSNNLLCLETICFFQFYANIAKTNINRVEIKTSWKYIFCVKFCCILSGVTTNDGVSVRQNYHLQHESLSWWHRQCSLEYCEIKKQKKNISGQENTALLQQTLNIVDKKMIRMRPDFLSNVLFVAHNLDVWLTPW